MKEEQTVNIVLIAKRIISYKKRFASIGIITAIISAIYIFLVPRTYTTEILLAPEISDITGKSGLSSIASSFGFNIGNASTGDAIYPDLYPQLMGTNDFAAHLVDHKVTTKDGKLTTTYYDYLLHHQKESPWGFPGKLISAIKEMFAKKQTAKKQDNTINLFVLTEDEANVLTTIRGNINCKIDAKSGIITITVQDQDPLITATIANAAKDELQQSITNYRTSKVQVDLDYYRKLTAEAKAKYEKARQLYGSYADANSDVVLESYKAKQTDLENDMQLKYNTYSTLNTQMEQAIAKVQEKTPVFTVIKGASVPLKPSAPKRMVFILLMVILSWVITTLYMCRRELKQLFIKGF